MLVVDTSINFEPHTDLGVFKYLGVDHPSAKGGWQGDDLIRNLDDAGVDMGGLIANVSAKGVGGAPNFVHCDRVADVVDAHPHRLFGWAGIDPLGGMDTLRYMEYAVKERGMKGIHIYPHWFGVPVNDRIYYPIYAKACELGVPIAMQVGRASPRSGAKTVAQPARLEDVAFDFPELVLIGIHTGIPWTFELTTLAWQHENVYLLLDAYLATQWDDHIIRYIRQEDPLNMDGTSKVMWGSDHPVQDFKKAHDAVYEIDLSDDQRRALLGGNAIRILGLDVPKSGGSQPA